MNRQEAIKSKVPRYDGLPCKKGHGTLRYTTGGNCVVCNHNRPARGSELKRPYYQHKSNSKLRGVEFKLTYKEWKKIWDDSGKYHLRGRGRGKYVMSRHGDKGAYEVGNVHIQLFEDNLSDSHKNGCH